MTLKLKRNESFYIREGWVEKAINTINKENTNIFSKNDGVRFLGIGTNMVKGLKYWLKSAGIIDGKTNELSEFGKLLCKYDPYMDDKFSWYFLHYFLSTNKEECPVFYKVFSQERLHSFRKSNLADIIIEEYSKTDPDISRKNLETDINVFIKTYVNEETILNPEDNYACPLSALKLLKKNGNLYEIITPAYNELDFRIIYYALTSLYQENNFIIEDSMKEEKSPFSVFGLDKYSYLRYLDDMKKAGMIQIVKTAGLNTVSILHRYSLEEIFEDKYGGLK